MTIDAGILCTLRRQRNLTTVPRELDVSQQGLRIPFRHINERSGCLFAILKLFGISPTPAKLPYRRKDYLLTQAERSLFGVLSEAIKGRYFIFAKVRLADLLWMPKDTVSRQSHFNRINTKHVDFVICDLASVRPLLCLELDDATHASDKIAMRSRMRQF
jgi:hypothetical protein